MDAFMKNLGRLSELASARVDPAPLDPSGVMARIRGMTIEDSVIDLPIRFFAGGAAAAAAAAVAVSLFAASAWTDLNSPVLFLDSLIDVMDIVL